MVARTYSAGTPVWYRNATTNDSDLTVTVPANKRWIIRLISADLVATATVGNRILMAEIGNGTALVYKFDNTGSIAATNSGKICYAQDLPNAANSRRLLTTSADSSVGRDDPMPSELSLPAGYTIRVYDETAVDAAADDMIVVLYYEELDI